MMVRNRYLLSGVCAIVVALGSPPAAAQTLGGLLETVNNAVARAALTAAEITGFMPQRGAFDFPAPYNTEAFRITNAGDCGGADCVNYAGYSYWRNMNNHVGMESMLIFLGLDRSRGGKGPSLYELNKATGRITDLGALFPESHKLSWASGEGWYFSATRPTTLYVFDGPRIARFDVITEEMETVFDITDQMGRGHYVRQMHSSDDDNVHSATVHRDSDYRALGCMAYEEDKNRFHYYPIPNHYDECQIDRSGRWLVIKANLDGRNGEDNLIVDLQTGNERVLLDHEGAAGHSDMGHGYMIAADNWAKEANTWKMWDFNKPELVGERVYYNKTWGSAPDHVTHTNSRPDLPAEQQHACGSSVSRGRAIHSNEIICFALDGGATSVAVAPTMTRLDASGGGNDYARSPKGNLDVTGRYFLWTSNLGGARLDAFVVRIPDSVVSGSPDNVGGGGSYKPPVVSPPPKPAPKPDPVNPGRPGSGQVPPPFPEPTDEVTPDAILWNELENMSAHGQRITKTSGCDGCSDGGAVSLQHVGHGHARLEFTAQSSEPLFFVGLTDRQSVPASQDFVYSLRLQSGNAEVRERGGYRADTSFNVGDRFTINADGKTVTYARNGNVFHTSSAPASYPMFAGVSLYNIESSLEDLEFDVNPAPQISDVKVRARAAEELEISWVTDQAAENMVQYGETSKYTASSTPASELKTAHKVVLRDLKPGATYHFRALARDASGHISSSGDMVYTLPN